MLNVFLEWHETLFCRNLLRDFWIGRKDLNFNLASRCKWHGQLGTRLSGRASCSVSKGMWSQRADTCATQPAWWKRVCLECQKREMPIHRVCSTWFLVRWHGKRTFLPLMSSGKCGSTWYFQLTPRNKFLDLNRFSIVLDFPSRTITCSVKFSCHGFKEQKRCGCCVGAPMQVDPEIVMEVYCRSWRALLVSSSDSWRCA